MGSPVLTSARIRHDLAASGARCGHTGPTMPEGCGAQAIALAHTPITWKRFVVCDRHPQHYDILDSDTGMRRNAVRRSP